MLSMDVRSIMADSVNLIVYKKTDKYPYVDMLTVAVKNKLCRKSLTVKSVSFIRFVSSLAFNPF